MVHAGLFFAMASLAIGFVALTRSILSYQRTRLRFHRTFAVFLSLYLYFLLPSFVFGYLRLNDRSVLLGQAWRALQFAHNVQRPVLRAVMAFVCISLFLLVQRESWRRSWLVVFWAAQLAAASFFLLTFASVLVLPPPREDVLHGVALLVSLVVVYGSVVAVAVRAQIRTFEYANPAQARALTWFGRTVTVIFAVYFGVDLIGLLNLVTGPATGVVSVLPIFLFMTARVVYLERFVTIMYPLLDRDRPAEEKFRSLTVEYGISRREEDVIRLICQGRTNKEIEDALFISLPTVKDHISNIFRKTGVANRVQLAALFHFTGDRPPQGDLRKGAFRAS